MLPTPLRILIVHDNAENRAILSRTLLRKYPDAVFLEAQDSDRAMQTLEAGPISVVLVQRAADLDSEAMVAMVRNQNATVPIIAVSGIDRSEKALRAGANRFLYFEKWLMIGTVVEDVLAERPA